MGKESFKMQDSSKTDFNVKKIKTVENLTWFQTPQCNQPSRKLPPVEFDCGIKEYPQLSQKGN